MAVQQLDEAEQLRRRQRSNIIVAKFIPVFLTGIVVYASYVFVGPLCVNYLINTPPDAGVEPRIGVAIALPIVYFILMLLMAACYFRLLYIVSFDPGYVEQRSERVDGSIKDGEETKQTTRSCMPNSVSEGQGLTEFDYDGIIRRGVAAPPGIEDFYSRDAFVCDRNGLPMWCHTCGNWKADRVHHSRDVGRCVRRMDHFCPWVGGMVGENGFKFFLQFNIYAAIFSIYAMSVMAYFVAEAKRKTGTIGDAQWVVVLGLGGFFAMFTFGLAMTAMYLTLRNLTSVENIDVGNRVMYLAVLLPPALQHMKGPPPLSSNSTHSSQPLVSEIDDPSHQSYFTNNERPARSRRRSRDDVAASIWQGTISYPLDKPETNQLRRFAILKTPPGMNPWDLGPAQNLGSIFGSTLYEWTLPVKRSPCTDHSNQISYYPLGWDFEQLLSDARLVDLRDNFTGVENSTVSKGTRKKKRKLAEGWQNGERPDAWILEKEARRVRRQRQEPLEVH